jgi:MFS family permease
MNSEDADKASLNVALTLTLALPGDTVLYLLLPLHAAAFGITLPEAGLLLAANRIVRVFGYHWVANFYATRGPRAACLLAAAGAVLSTFGYAALSGLWPLLVARLLWGLAFAAMNIANQALPTSHLQDAPRRMGRARSIVAVGPMAGLLAGGIMAELFGPRPCLWRSASLLWPHRSSPCGCRRRASPLCSGARASLDPILSASGLSAWGLRSMDFSCSGFRFWPLRD